MAAEGGRHICALGQKGKPVPHLKAHEKLYRAPLHIDNEDQVLQIAQDRPLT